LALQATPGDALQPAGHGNSMLAVVGIAAGAIVGGVLFLWLL